MKERSATPPSTARWRGAASVLIVSAVLSAASGVARADAVPSAEVCATASDDAQPLRKAGKLLEAKERLVVCTHKRCPSLVRSDCVAQLAEIEKATPTILFSAKDGRGRDVTAASVTVDGVARLEHLDGSPVAVDPGTHHVVFTAPNEDPVAVDLTIGEGEKERSEAVTIGKVPERAPPAPRPSPPIKEVAEGPADLQLATYTAFGVGAAGLLVGSIFGAMALSTKSNLDSECPSKSGCPQGDVDALAARGWVSNIGFGIGIIGAGVGTVLLLTSNAPDKANVGVAIGPSHVGVVATLP